MLKVKKSMQINVFWTKILRRIEPARELNLNQVIGKDITIKKNMDIISFSALAFLGEFFIFFSSIEFATIIYIIDLWLIIFLAYRSNKRIYPALIFIPLLRILNISVPIFFTQTLYSYWLVYAVMIIPIYIVLRNKKFNPKELGFNFEKLDYYIPFGIFIGLILGGIEYQILHPESLLQSFGIREIIILSVIMIFFVGFVEEFIFRSMIQIVLENRLGAVKGILATSILFGIMSSGYGLITEILFSTLVGLIFGFLFKKTRSLMLVMIAHGFTNITLFMIIPLLLSSLTR